MSQEMLAAILKAAEQGVDLSALAEALAQGQGVEVESKGNGKAHAKHEGYSRLTTAHGAYWFIKENGNGRNADKYPEPEDVEKPMSTRQAAAILKVAQTLGEPATATLSADGAIVVEVGRKPSRKASK